MTSKWIRSVMRDKNKAALAAQLNRHASGAHELPAGQARIAGLAGMMAGAPQVRPGTMDMVMGRLAEARLRSQDAQRQAEPGRKRA